jgi:hypothetical protein
MTGSILSSQPGVIHGGCGCYFNHPTILRLGLPIILACKAVMLKNKAEK